MPYRTDDLDMVLPTLTSAGYLWPCGPNGTPGTNDPCGVGFLPTRHAGRPVKAFHSILILDPCGPCSIKECPTTTLCKRR